MGARILVIEDQPEDADILADLLRGAGYEVRVASTGADGLAQAREWKPGLVLCDLVLPDVGGVYVSLRMKTEPALAKVPIVAVTALTAFETGSSVVGAGFAACISKPVDPQSLLRQVAAILARY